jgi:hypothetical protein
LALRAQQSSGGDPNLKQKPPSPQLKKRSKERTCL